MVCENICRGLLSKSYYCWLRKLLFLIFVVIINVLGNGTIDFQEFVAMMTKHMKSPQDEERVCFIIQI